MLRRVRDGQSGWESDVLTYREWYDGTYGQHSWVLNPYTGRYEQDYGATTDGHADWVAPDIQSTVDDLAAMNSTVAVEFSCEPKTDSLDARQAANAGTRILGDIRKTLDAVAFREMASKLAETDGEVWAMPIFDGAFGCPRRRLIPALDALVSPGAETPEEAEWTAHDRAERLDDLVVQWAATPAAVKKLRAITPDLSRLHPMQVERLRKVAGPAGTTDERDLRTYVRAIDVFYKPTEKHPHGRWFFYVNETRIFQQDALPYAHIDLMQPMFKLGLRHVPGRLRDIGLVQDMISDVVYMERLMNLQLDTMLLATWGKVLVREGSVVGGLDGKFTDQPHEIIEIARQAPADAVSYVRPLPPDGSALRLLDVIAQKLNTKTGVNDPNRGIVTPDTTLGAQQIALAAGRQRAQGFYRKVDEFERKINEAALVMTQRLSPHERVERIVGVDRQAELASFYRAAIVETKDSPQMIAVVAESAPSLSDNAAMKTMQVERWVELGIVQPIEARDMVDLPLPKGALTAVREDNRRLLRELVPRAARGEQIPISPWWDHEAMLDAVRQVVTQHDYLSMEPRARASVDAFFAQIEAWIVAKKRGTAVAENPGAGAPPPTDPLAQPPQDAPPDGQFSSLSDPELTNSVTSQKVAGDGREQLDVGDPGGGGGYGPGA